MPVLTAECFLITPVSTAFTLFTAWHLYNFFTFDWRFEMDINLRFFFISCVQALFSLPKHQLLDGRTPCLYYNNL